MAPTRRWVDVCTLASGSPLRLALLEIGSSTDGPRLGVSALIHGDEIVGVEVIRRLTEVVNPRSLRGSVLLLPVANPLAFEALSRGTPLAVEIGNLNRVFPGDPEGDLSSRLAHAITTEFLEPITHFVDLHAGGTHPVVDYCISLHDLDFALAFGQRVVRQVQGYAGTLGAAAAAQGKPALVAELGGGYLVDDHYINLGIRGILNVMKHLGMIDGAPELPREQLVIERVTTLRSAHGGLLYPAVGLDALGKEVAEKTLLGRVCSPYTFETLEELRAPYRRNVVLLLRVALTRVNPGDYAFMVGDAEGAQTRTNPRTKQ